MKEHIKFVLKKRITKLLDYTSNLQKSHQMFQRQLYDLEIKIESVQRYLDALKTDSNPGYTTPSKLEKLPFLQQGEETPLPSLGSRQTPLAKNVLGRVSSKVSHFNLSNKIKQKPEVSMKSKLDETKVKVKKEVKMEKAEEELFDEELSNFDINTVIETQRLKTEVEEVNDDVSKHKLKAESEPIEKTEKPAKSASNSESKLVKKRKKADRSVSERKTRSSKEQEPKRRKNSKTASKLKRKVGRPATKSAEKYTKELGDFETYQEELDKDSTC